MAIYLHHVDPIQQQHIATNLTFFEYLLSDHNPFVELVKSIPADLKRVVFERRCHRDRLYLLTKKLIQDFVLKGLL